MRERSIFTLYVQHSLDLEVSYLWVVCPFSTALLGWVGHPNPAPGHTEERLLRGCCSSAVSGTRRMMEAEQMVKLDEACVCSTLTFLPGRARQGLETS